MGVTKTTNQEGTGATPTKGQKVTIEYTGWLKDTSKPGNKGNKSVFTPFSTIAKYRTLTQLRGNRFDSSVGKADFVVRIGTGQVIKGTYTAYSPPGSLITTR